MKSDLYFILNPGLGIIKIGIAIDVEDRRKTLEYGCGVPLEVLRVVPGAADLEQELHALFNASRLLGEWFTPTEDLVRLATGKGDVREFMKANAAAIAAGRNAREAEMVRRKAEQDAAAKEDVARAASLRAEEKALKKERERAQAEAQKKRDEKRRKQLDESRARSQADHDAMIAREWQNYRKLHRPETGEPIAVRRHIIREQRERNAAMVGTTPILNPNQTERPRQEGEAMGAN